MLAGLMSNKIVTIGEKGRGIANEESISQGEYVLEYKYVIPERRGARMSRCTKATQEWLHCVWLYSSAYFINHRLTLCCSLVAVDTYWKLYHGAWFKCIGDYIPLFMPAVGRIPWRLAYLEKLPIGNDSNLQRVPC